MSKPKPAAVEPPQNRCSICGEFKDKSQVSEGNLGPKGQGHYAAVQACSPCREDIERFFEGDGCSVCGSEDPTYSFELEGVFGVDRLEFYFAGGICADCSQDRIFNLIQQADWGDS